MKYGALTIDTSIFDRYGLSLDTEPLKSLVQFKDKPVGLVLVDVVLLELRSHLAKKIEDQLRSINKAARTAKLLNFEPTLVQAIEQASSSADAQEFAVERIEGFLQETGAENLKAGDHVAVDELLDRYFGARPPFASSGQKKREFPDAICLLALESYAKAKNVKILAVSGDRDWVEFAQQSDHIDVETDLSAAIAHFHPQTAAFNFCHRFIADWNEDEFQSLAAELESHVGNEVQNFEFEVTAQSSLGWDLDDLEVRLDSMELIETGDPEYDIKVINLDNDTVTFNVKAKLFCVAEAQFGFSVYDSMDKDYTRLGSCSATAQPELDVEVFVRVSGDLGGPVAELEVDTVDVRATSRLIVDFHHIEPDWHDNDYE